MFLWNSILRQTGKELLALGSIRNPVERIVGIASRNTSYASPRFLTRNRPKIAPKSPQNRPKIAQNRPKTAQILPKS